MKKIITLFVLSLSTFLALTSCGKDDDESPTPETSKRVQRIFATNTTNGLQNEYRFQYNEDNTIKSIVKISNQISFTMQFEYTNTTIRANSFPSEGDAFEISMHFENDVLTTINVDEQEFPVSYNANTNAYGLFGGQLLIDEDGDIASFATNFIFDYDSTKKGAFYNVSSEYHQLMFLILEEKFLTAILSSKPVTSFHAGIERLTFSNTYDRDGYLLTATSGSVHFDYQYVE